MKKNIFFAIIIINLITNNTILGELKILYTAALLKNNYEERKKEYITCLDILSKYGFKNPYIVEAIQGTGPSFFDKYSTNVFYSKVHDFNVKDIANKGINEARTMLDAINHFNFNPNDMIMKITGRYYFVSDKFIKLVKQNPDVDIFVKVISNGTWAITGCFAIRAHYLKDMIENLDYVHMEKNNSYIEAEFASYLNKIIKTKNPKIKYVDMIDLAGLMIGNGFNSAGMYV